MSLLLPILDRFLFVDLLIQNAQSSALVIEVKCFQDERNFHDEFYHAVGQYLTYRALLKINGNSYPLYLSVPLNVYQRYFVLPHIKAVVNDAKIEIVVVDLMAEEIHLWTS